MELSYEEQGYLERLTNPQINAYEIIIDDHKCWWLRYQVGQRLPDRALRIVGNSVAQEILREREQAA